MLDAITPKSSSPEPLDPLATNDPAAAGDSLAKIDTLLRRFTHSGIRLGLERVYQLLDALGNPHQRVPIVHVAGSNGKGSVCAYLSSVLTEAGYRVGRYTSPHLVHWCERFCLNEQEISANELYQILQQVVGAIPADQPDPTLFEVTTVAAWLYFAQQQVDIAVIEVGLGGRLDATNVCDRPLVSVITSLSREHWQYLGSTLAEISAEKAGILKPNRSAVIAPQPADAEAVLQQRLTALGCPAIWVKPAIDRGAGWAEFQGGWKCGNMEASLTPLKYPLPLPGAHQLINSAVAIAALQVLQQQGWQITDQQIVQGMANTRWRGRLQWISWRGEPLLIDGAHNPAGAEMLRHYVDHNEQVTHPIRWVMGMMGTKDHAEIYKALLRPGDRLYLVPVPDAPTDLNALATLAKEVCPDLADCQIHPDEMTGLEAASRAEATGTLVLCGSLYLIGHFLRQGQFMGV